MLTRHLVFLSTLVTGTVYALPQGFVYLKDVSPSIIQDLRYTGSNNFMGHPSAGYKKSRCILSIEAAAHLAQAEKAAQKKGYLLKVYDCYRPNRAVKEFYKWSQDPNDVRMKAAFYPREDKAALFANHYISLTSGHTRGSTVDLTLVTINGSKPRHKPSVQCFSKTDAHRDDDSVNAGTRFDCLDKSANPFYPNVSKEQKKNRLLLRKIMLDAGFYPSKTEWWHFTLQNEPFPNTYFNFLVK